MNTSRGKPMRLYGGRTSSYESCDSRFSLTPHVSPGRGMRNVHRGHAHGHVAFGLNSEFPLHSATPMRVRRARPMRAQRAVHVSPSPRRCTHPLHGMGAATRSLTPRRGAQAKWPSSQVADCRKSHWDELSRRDRACVNISSGKGQSKSGSVGEQRRHGDCIGTRFISLLKQEAHQIRERRLAEESLRDRRPSWTRC